MSDAVGTIQDFKTKSKKVTAIQFTGKNARDFVEFVNSNTTQVVAKNGGTYIKLIHIGEVITARKGDWIVLDAEGDLEWMTDDMFKFRHSIGKNHGVM